MASKLKLSGMELASLTVFAIALIVTTTIILLRNNGQGHASTTVCDSITSIVENSDKLTGDSTKANGTKSRKKKISGTKESRSKTPVARDYLEESAEE